MNYNFTDLQIKEFNTYYKNNTALKTSIYFNILVSSIKKYLNPKRILLNEKQKKQNKVLAVTKRRKKVRQLLVEYKGGKCSICNYNKCIAALHFHHIDPKTKSFGLSQSGLTKSLSKMKQEADKCIILCANCHAETHYYT